MSKKKSKQSAYVGIPYSMTNEWCQKQANSMSKLYVGIPYYTVWLMSDVKQKANNQHMLEYHTVWLMSGAKKANSKLVRVSRNRNTVQYCTSDVTKQNLRLSLWCQNVIVHFMYTEKKTFANRTGTLTLSMLWLSMAP